MFLDPKIREIYLPLEYDPDFGDQRQDDAHGFVINVYNIKHSHSFILLMPLLESDEELESLLKAVMQTFLEPKDQYTIRDLYDEDVQIFKKKPIPILSYHPESLLDDQVSFYWQYPPKRKMN